MICTYLIFRKSANLKQPSVHPPTVHADQELRISTEVSLMCVFVLVPVLGTDGHTKTDEFSEKFQRGGVIFNPKNYIFSIFWTLNRAFSA